MFHRFIQTRTADGYRGTKEKLRRRHHLFGHHLSMVHPESSFNEKFEDKTWPSVNPLKRDKDPAVAINAIPQAPWQLVHTISALHL